MFRRARIVQAQDKKSKSHFLSAIDRAESPVDRDKFQTLCHTTIVRFNPKIRFGRRVHCKSCSKMMGTKPLEIK